MNKKKIIIGFLIASLVAAAGYFYFNVDERGTVDTQSEQGNIANQGLTKQDIRQNDGTDINKNTEEIKISDEIRIRITELYQDNQSVIYKAIASKSLEKGVCSALFTNDLSKPVAHTSDPQNGACGPFSIPLAQFDAKGQWKLTLRYFIDDVQFVDTKTFEVN